jgi:hypothetical protein
MNARANDQEILESKAIYFAGIVAAVALVVARLWFGNNSVGFFGTGSIGNIASVLAGIAAFVGFLMTWRSPIRIGGSKYGWVHRALVSGTLAFMVSAICVLFTVVLFYLTNSAFFGLRLDPWTAAITASVVSAVAGYVCFLAGPKTTSENLSVTLAAFMVSGAMVSMITAPNPYWWQIHFSSLGGGSSGSATAFNLTLVIGGLVLIGLADLVGAEFSRLKSLRKNLAGVKVSILRLEIAGIGVALSGVGLFAYDTHLGIHNLAATLMGIIFLALTLTLRWVARGMPAVFYGFSYVMALAVVVCLWLFKGVGYFNLTAAELTMAGIIFAWFVVFVRQIAAGLAL